MSYRRKRILILAANPRGTDRLRLDEEVREIQAGLERAQQREQFEIISLWAIRSKDLRRALLDFKPQILHFSGHGTGETGIVVEGCVGQVQLLSTKALADLLRLFQECVECVVLNACYSEVQAEAISQHIHYVIGMSQEVGDRAALNFAVGFYDALGAGRSYADAYKFGCNAIDLENITEALTPKIKVNQALPRHSEQTIPPQPKPPLSSPSLPALYSHAHQLYQAGRWQDVINVFGQIKALDASYPDPRGLLPSAQREQRLASLFDRARLSESRRDFQTALRQFEEVHQLRKGYRDTEIRIAKLRTQLQPKPLSSQSSLFTVWLLLAWSLSWALIGVLAYIALGGRASNSNSTLFCAGFGLLGGVASSLVGQLVGVQARSLNLRHVVQGAGLCASIWMLIGFVASISGEVPSAAPIAAIVSLVSNVLCQIFQSKSNR